MKKRKQQNNQFLLPVIIGGAAILVVGLIIILSVVRFGGVEQVIEEIVEQKDVLRHPLTGEKVEELADTLPQVFAVMVENAADAWPLVGLDEAFLVIEAPVEGDIPRFIVFSTEEDEIQKIGPVRSARPYYVEWALGMDALYGHVGGSPEALDLIRELGVQDVNEFYQGEYFYRQNGTRYAPHNVYTDSDLLRGAMEEVNPDAPEYDYWTFTDGEVKGNTSFDIDWSAGYVYDVTWEFDAEKNQYLRYQGNDVMELEDGAQVYADNVIVMATDIRVIDSVGRKSLETIGEGDAYIAHNGELYLGMWKKESADAPLRFYTIDGYEISMNAGKTWVEVVSELSQVERHEK